MEKRNYLCVSCFHVITNPICPDCFLRQVEAWLMEKRIATKTKQRITKELAKIVNVLADEPANTNCILCGSRNVNICLYCLIWKTHRIVKKYIENEEIIENLEEVFNYNI